MTAAKPIIARKANLGGFSALPLALLGMIDPNRSAQALMNPSSPRYYRDAYPYVSGDKSKNSSNRVSGWICFAA
jgi:hypothetical protein